MLNDKGKRKKEVEDKLLVLNAKKHNLVLVLKHVSSGLAFFFMFITHYIFRCSCS